MSFIHVKTYWTYRYAHELILNNNKVYQDSCFQDAFVIYFFDFFFDFTVFPKLTLQVLYNFTLEENYLAFQSWCKKSSNVKRLSLNFFCWVTSFAPCKPFFQASSGPREKRLRGRWGEVQVGAQGPSEGEGNRKNRKVNLSSGRSLLQYVAEDPPYGVAFYMHTS